MSIWKRGTNLVKGMIAEASKSDDPEKMRALEKELQEREKTATTHQRGNRVSPKSESDLSGQPSSDLQDGDRVSSGRTDAAESNPSSEKPLTPKKRTI